MIAFAVAVSLAVSVLPADAPRLSAESSSASLFAHEEPYRGGPVPEGAHIENRDNNVQIIGGLLVAGIAYGISASAAPMLWLQLLASSYEAGAPPDFSALWLVVPLAGPIIAAASPMVGLPIALATTLRLVYALDGALQIGGLVFAWLGFTSRHQVIVYPERAQLSVLPGAPGAPLGLTLRVAHF